MNDELVRLQLDQDNNHCHLRLVEYLGLSLIT